MLAQVGCVGHTPSESRYHFFVFLPSLIEPSSKSHVVTSNQIRPEALCRSLVTHAVTTTMPLLLHARTVALSGSGIDGVGVMGVGEGVRVATSVDGLGIVVAGLGAQPRLLSTSTTVQIAVLGVRRCRFTRLLSCTEPVGPMPRKIRFTLFKPNPHFATFKMILDVPMDALHAASLRTNEQFTLLPH